MKVRKGYTFDDVLLIPKRSSVQSRRRIDLSVDLGRGVKLGIPVVSANMRDVTGPLMAKEIAKLGGLAILHRFHDKRYDVKDDYFKATNDLTQKEKMRVGLSIGISDVDKDILCSFDQDLPVICVDLAHGHSDHCMEMTRYVRNKHKDALIISGNVATVEGACALFEAGADVIKVGIGNGALCSTRIETGNGVPQLTALEDIYDYAESKRFKVIADGGIKRAGDLTKSLCFSHAVMLGNILAGTNEAPGEVITVDGIKYKTYAGSSTHKTNHIEGVTGLVPTKGSVKTIIQKLMEGLSSGCSYQGVNNLSELREDPEFVEISNAGLIESHPHSVKVQ